MLIAAGCAALLLVGGSSYLISHLADTSKTAAPKVPLSNPASISAHPLRKVTDSAEDLPINTAVSSAPTTIANSTSSSPSTAHGLVASSTLAPAPVLPSFDIMADTSAITKGVGTLYVPFTIIRHGGLSTPIVPGQISITAGGSLTDLITVQMETMLDHDHGAAKLLTLEPFPHDIIVHISARSGDVVASTSFPYHIGS